MKVEIDGTAVMTALNSVKVIIGEGREIHVTVTDEGVVFDAVVDGEIVETESREHDFYALEE